MPPVASEPKISPATRALPNAPIRAANSEERGDASPFAEMLDSAAPPAPERTERAPERQQASSSRRNAANSAGERQHAEAPAKTKSKDSSDEGKTADDAEAPAADASEDTQDTQDGAKKAADAVAAVTAEIDPLNIEAAKPDETPADDTAATDPAQTIESADAAVIAAPAAPAPAPAAATPALQAQGEAAPEIIEADGAAPQIELPKETTKPQAEAAGKDSAKADAEAPKFAPAPAKPAPAPAPAPAHADAKPIVNNGKGKNPESAAPAEKIEAPAKSERPAARTEAAPDAPTAQSNTSAVKAGADQAQPLSFTAQVQHAAATSPNHAPAAPAVTVPVEGLAVEIAARAQAGKNRFEIRLDPPELGRIDVRLDVDKHGQVTSRLIVERAETLDLLRRDAPQLERALQDAGLKTSDNGLQFSLRQQSGDQNSPGTNPDAAHLFVTDDELPSIEATQRGYGRLAGMGGGLDIRV